MRVTSLSLACLVVLASLSGCSPSNSTGEGPLPTLSRTATPTTTPTPLAVTKLVISGDALTLYFSDGTESGVLPYSEPSDVFIATLSEVFGAEPEISTDEGGICAPPFTRHAWGGFEVHTDDDWLPEDANVRIHTSTGEESGVAVQSSLGIGVGDDSSAVAASHPDNLKFVGESEGVEYSYFYFDVSNLSSPDGDPTDVSDEPFPVGGESSGIDGILTEITSPVVYAYNAHC